MAELYGRKISRPELLRRIGNLQQVAGIREYTYNSGRADGVRAIAVDTGLLKYELLPGRCLDIGFASYKGLPVGYASKSGVCHPAFYNKTDPTSFLDNFLAGVMTTCGLHNIGPASGGAGRPQQMHGHLANIPAEKVGAREVWDGDDCAFHVDGEIHHSSFYNEDLVLRRNVSSRLGEACFHIIDEVENLDFAPSPCLILYHVQFGYPFLDAGSFLITSPIRKSEARPGTPDAELDRFDRFDPPTDGADESCFYHSFRSDVRGWATACLFNPNLGERGMGVYVRYDVRTLPVFVQWKMLRSREYVCGLEPGNARLDGRSAEEMATNTLAPLEKRLFELEIGVVEGEDECRKLAGCR